MKKSTKLDTAILLISEITKGMKSIGSKSLLFLNKDSTVIDHQIQYIKKHYNPSKIVLCTGFDHTKIEQHTKKYSNIEYFYNADYETDNQAGTLIKCLKHYSPKDTLIITNGLLLFDKISIPKSSATFFIQGSKDRRNQFDIGSNNLDKDGYLFYGLNHKWIETVFLKETDINIIASLQNPTSLYKLFLFELLNIMQNQFNNIHFVDPEKQNTHPIKINSLKDIIYVKKYYKKYTCLSN